MRKLLLATCAALMIVSPALAHELKHVPGFKMPDAAPSVAQAQAAPGDNDGRKVVLVCDNRASHAPDRYATAQVFPTQKIAWVLTGLTKEQLYADAVPEDKAFVSYSLTGAIFLPSTDEFGRSSTSTIPGNPQGWDAFSEAFWKGGQILMRGDVSSGGPTMFLDSVAGSSYVCRILRDDFPFPTS